MDFILLRKVDWVHNLLIANKKKSTNSDKQNIFCTLITVKPDLIWIHLAAKSDLKRCEAAYSLNLILKVFIFCVLWEKHLCVWLQGLALDIPRVVLDNIQ